MTSTGPLPAGFGGTSPVPVDEIIVADSPKNEQRLAAYRAQGKSVIRTGFRTWTVTHTPPVVAVRRRVLVARGVVLGLFVVGVFLALGLALWGATEQLLKSSHVLELLIPLAIAAVVGGVLRRRVGGWTRAFIGLPPRVGRTE